MHWGAGVNSPAEWARPTDEILPAKSERHKDAVQTEFQPAQSGGGEREGWEAVKGRVGEIRLTLPNSIKALNFVLKSGDNWYKSD
eukprot:05484_4